MTAQTTSLLTLASSASPTGPIRLEPWEQRRLPQKVARIRVIQGVAWVTSEGRDFVLREGESLSLPRQRFPAVISALGVASVLFEEITWK